MIMRWKITKKNICFSGFFSKISQTPPKNTDTHTHKQNTQTHRHTDTHTDTHTHTHTHIHTHTYTHTHPNNLISRVTPKRLLIQIIIIQDEHIMHV